MKNTKKYVSLNHWMKYLFVAIILKILDIFVGAYLNQFYMIRKIIIIEHNHIIFFTELSINRLIISENLLIDGTFTYPKGFY